MMDEFIDSAFNFVATVRTRTHGRATRDSASGGRRRAGRPPAGD